MNNNDESWIGKRYGRLVVQGFQRKKTSGWNWIVLCDCGKTKEVNPSDVKNGKTRSCGCLHDEVISKRARKFNHGVYENKRLYGIYNGIKSRCSRKSSARYDDYGGRGIKVCDEWLNPVNGFDNFVEWSIKNGYSENLSIDRMDVDKGYSPDNCRWVTMYDQSLNKRQTRWVTYNGEKIQLFVLCKNLGVSYDTVHDRIYKRGWTLERALFEKSEREGSLMSKCKEKGVNYATVRDRIAKFGWTEERALNTPTEGRGANITTYGAKSVRKVCPVCGAEFETIYKIRKYCGQRCLSVSKSAKYKREKENTSKQTS